MGAMEKRLAHNGFFWAHRGYLVNLQRVQAVVPYTRDSYALIFDDGLNTEIPLSKTTARIVLLSCCDGTYIMELAWIQ